MAYGGDRVEMGLIGRIRSIQPLLSLQVVGDQSGDVA